MGAPPALQINGTPAFILGKAAGGRLEGTVLRGVLPYPHSEKKSTKYSEPAALSILPRPAPRLFVRGQIFGFLRFARQLPPEALQSTALNFSLDK
jgi:hypothetical protein